MYSVDGFFALPLRRQDQPALGFIKIAPAQLGDCNGVPVSSTPLGRITALRHFAESITGKVARALGRDDAIAAESDPPASAIAVPVLQDEGLSARRLHPKPKPWQLIIPCKHVAPGFRACRVHRSFRQLRHRVSTG